MVGIALLGMQGLSRLLSWCCAGLLSGVLVVSSSDWGYSDYRALRTECKDTVDCGVDIFGSGSRTNFFGQG